jgi:hypothetical protein
MRTKLYLIIIPADEGRRVAEGTEEAGGSRGSGQKYLQ